MRLRDFDKITITKAVTPAKAGAYPNICDSQIIDLGSSLRWNDDVFHFSDGAE